MKKLAYIVLAVFCTSLVLMSTINDAIVMSFYQLNKAELTRKYCVNIENPQLDCNASCYISSFLSSNESDSTEKISIVKQVEIYFVVESISDLRVHDWTARSPRKTFFYSSNYRYDIGHSVEYPPWCFC